MKSLFFFIFPPFFDGIIIAYAGVRVFPNDGVNLKWKIVFLCVECDVFSFILVNMLAKEIL